MPADAIPAPADYDGDGCTDIAAKGSNGIWYIDYCRNGFGGAWDDTFATFGTNAAIPVPADYDGDGKIDLAIKDDTGIWAIDYAYNGFGAIDDRFYARGFADAHPVPADYDGDGKDDLAIKGDGGGWLIDYAADGFSAWNDQHSGWSYGPASWVPVPGYYDGFGHCLAAPATACSLNSDCGAGDRCARKADLAVKTATGDWYIDFARNGFGAPGCGGTCQWDLHVTGYGDATAIPVPGDYDGDGYTDLAIKDINGTWFIDYAALDDANNPCAQKPCFGAWNQQLFNHYGGNSATAVPGDYTPGDTNRLDLAVQDRTTGTWSIDKATDGYGGAQAPGPIANASRPNVRDATAPHITATTLYDPTGTAVAPSAGRVLLTTGVRYTIDLTIAPGNGLYTSAIARARNYDEFDGLSQPRDPDDVNIRIPSFFNVENQVQPDGFLGPKLSTTFHRFFSIACSAPGVGLVAFKLHDHETHVNYNPDPGVVIECAPAAGHPTGLHGIVTARGCSGATCGTGNANSCSRTTDGHYTPGCPLQGATVMVSGYGSVVTAADGSWSAPLATGGPYTIHVVCSTGNCTSSCAGSGGPRSDAYAVNVRVPAGSGIEIDTPLEEQFFDDSSLTYATYYDYRFGRTAMHVARAQLTSKTARLAQNPTRKTLIHTAAAGDRVLMNGGYFDQNHTGPTHWGDPVGYFYAGGASTGCNGFAVLGQCSGSGLPCYVDSSDVWFDPPAPAVCTGNPPVCIPLVSAPGQCPGSEVCSSNTAAEVLSLGTLPMLVLRGTSAPQSASVVTSDGNFWSSPQFALAGAPACPLYHDASGYADYAIQATNGPPLVSGGAAQYSFDPGDEAWARTAIGVSANHNFIYLVVADGEGVNGGHGATFYQMSKFFSDVLQVDSAVNLDGGGSTEMVLRGQKFGGLRHVNTLTPEFQADIYNPFSPTPEADGCLGTVGNYVTLGL